MLPLLVSSALLFLIFGVGGLAVVGADSPVPTVNTGDRIGLKGYDPVAYFVNDQPDKGDERYSAV
jgi:hypothetical protein